MLHEGEDPWDGPLHLQSKRQGEKRKEEGEGKGENEVTEIVRNALAKPEPRFHRVEWRWDGEGPGPEYVRRLRGGDMVEVVPCAMYPGWANHAHEGRVEVYVRCLRG